MTLHATSSAKHILAICCLLFGSSLVNTAWAAPESWQVCAAIAPAPERLSCFDQWASQQSHRAAEHQASSAVIALPSTPSETAPAISARSAINTKDLPTVKPAPGCRATRSSGFKGFWELDANSDCGVFTIRGYKPISLSWIGANSVNTQPSSPSLGHTAVDAVAYDHNETRIQLSVRTKIAQGLLAGHDDHRRDALWFAYSQQSYWQLFNAGISRPFRSTDHEPELMYVYPTDWPFSQHWRMAYAGLGVNHQSNGQSLPLSRSWNRHVLMAGFENGSGLYVQARLWKRVAEDAANDDNPGISNLMGRGELSAFWAADAHNSWGLTLRHALRSPANGSVRMEWMRSLGDSANRGLRLHTQLFTGYGDSLIDYNRRRTVLSIGLSLVDW